MKGHPCKTCLVKPCCKKSCEDYKQFDSIFETYLYTIGILIGLIIHSFVVYLMFKYVEYPKTGTIAYFGLYYIIMYLQIHRKNDFFIEPNQTIENVVLWVGLPIWLISVVVILFCELVGWDKYPQKHNPYYMKIERTNREREKEADKGNQNASAC